MVNSARKNKRHFRIMRRLYQEVIADDTFIKEDIIWNGYKFSVVDIELAKRSLPYNYSRHFKPPKPGDLVAKYWLEEEYLPGKWRVLRDRVPYGRNIGPDGPMKAKKKLKKKKKK